MEVTALKDEWKSVGTTTGVQSVMMPGALPMLTWSVDNLATLIQVCSSYL